MKIGILGGSFDPIHRGHLYLARETQKMFRLDRVVLMVARTPPHKPERKLATPLERHAMACLAVAGQKEWLVSDWELRQQGPSYTIRTMEHLRQESPRDRFSFIAGADSLRELHFWKDYDKLLEEHSFIFVTRAGVDSRIRSLNLTPSLRGRIREVCKTETPPIKAGVSYLAHLNPPPVSSSTIRSLLARGEKPGSRVLPAAVQRYIEKHSLYGYHQKSSR